MTISEDPVAITYYEDRQRITDYYGMALGYTFWYYITIWTVYPLQGESVRTRGQDHLYWSYLWRLFILVNMIA